MTDSLRFNAKGAEHHISLNQEHSDALESVIIGGVKYSLGGNQETVQLFREKTEKMQLATMSLEELKSRLSLLDDEEMSLSSVKSHGLGMEVILHKAPPLENVLNELKPTWPIPGEKNTASISSRMEDLGVPGVRIVLIDGGVPVSAGFGELKEEGKRIQAASISKTVTALTLMVLLQEQKTYSLDTNVKELIEPEEPELWVSISGGKDVVVTLRQLRGRRRERI